MDNPIRNQCFTKHIRFVKMSRLSIIKSLLLILILFADTIIVAQISTAGLIGYWPFNGNANDASGNNNNGILECETNLPQLTTDRFGNANSAYQFGGYYNKNWIRVPNNSTMQLGNQMSISFWYQQCNFSGMDGWGSYSTTNANFSLVTKAGDGIAAYPGIWINNNINAQTGNLNISSSNCNGSSSYYLNYSINTEYHCFDTCEWMHFVTVIDDNIARIYINGVLYCDSVVNHADFTQANLLDLYFGRMGCNGTIWYPFNGKLDDIAFYNRAITEAEVAQLFDNYYDPNYFDNQIIIENLIVQRACNGNDGSVQVIVNQINGPFQYALDHPTNFQNSNFFQGIGGGLHRIYVKSECGLADTLVDFSCLDIPLPDNIDSANCVFYPTATEWGIEVGWSSASMVSNLNIPLVGDLDNDGHPEIICFSMEGESPNNPNTDNQILVFDGVTKQLKTTITMSSPVTAYDAAAYGMVKLPSGKGLIVTACYDFKLRAYDITASNPNTPFWTSNVDYGSNYGDWAVNVSFADFNHDGHPEVYVRNKIYSAETGALLVATTSTENTGSSYCHWTHFTNYKLSAPMAADVCNDSRLELILGNEIYTVNITNPYGSSGNTITLEKQVTPPNGAPNDGNVQVADFNADGYMDVFVSVRNTAYLSGSVYGYVWDVHNDIVSNSLIISTSWSGKSIPMIADIDNDGLIEVLIQSGVSNSNEKFQAYKFYPGSQTFTLLWGFTTDEDSYSNSITSFDFNQDGLLELMICDQSTVRIVNGSGYSHTTGNDTVPVYVMSSLPFSETTIMQYPIIVDVDDDGNAEIVSVGSDKLNVFESSGSPWAPARKVWNQYMYNVTNVNQDLTVPQYLFNNATPFTDPQNVVRRPFNNFLQQATTINQYGRPIYAVPDAAALSANITTSGTNTTLNVTYTNQGDNTLNAPYYITVFANQLGNTVVQTITVNTPLPVGGTGQQNIALPMTVLCQLEDVTSLVVAINCNGGGIAQNGNLQPECDISNNTAQVSINLQSEPTNIIESACDQFVWYGQTYTQSGQFEITIPNTYGCDSTLVLNLTINHSDTTYLNIEACEEYLWYGTTYNQSGTYQHLLQTPAGCDSLLILNLNIGDSYYVEEIIEDCDSYFWPVNQQWYYVSTLDSIVTQGAQGTCDSTFVLNLTLHYSDTLDLDPVTACEGYEWHGTTYTESGLITYQTTNEFGCNRLERLVLTISETETIELPPVTECDEYIWHNMVYTESGNYTFDTLNQSGCLLEYILPLTINHSDTLDWDPVTACDSYLWYGTSITETGNYTHMSITPEGCDRLERIHVIINYNTFDIIGPVTACDDYLWHETTYSQSGVYSHETQDPGGCLHTEILFLTINQSSENEFSVTSCEPYEWYGVVYDNPGTYTHTLTNSQGCDSLLIMHLDIGETFVREENVVCCNEYEWHGTVYSQSGNYQYEATNPNGCDSVFILHLTVAPTYEKEMFVEACYSYVWVNELLTESGDYERHFNSEMGCDSLVTLHLTITEAKHHEFEQETCAESFSWNDITYYETGDYEQTLTANNGCDSIVTMHLKFAEQFNTNTTVDICENSYLWNGIEYYETGEYQQSFMSTTGCDSIVTLHLTLGTSLVCSIQGATLIYPATDLMSGVYSYHIDSIGIDPDHIQWSIDRDDWLLIPQGASCDLVCLSAGQGLLHAWTEGEPCNIDTTLLLNASFFDVGENEASMRLYPNPTKGKITVEWDEIREINVYDLLGQKLMACKYGKEPVCVLDLSCFQHSVYVLEIISSTSRVIRPVVLTQ